jgi:hypothetical protein
VSPPNPFFGAQRKASKVALQDAGKVSKLGEVAVGKLPCGKGLCLSCGL